MAGEDGANARATKTNAAAEWEALIITYFKLEQYDSIPVILCSRQVLKNLFFIIAKRVVQLLNDSFC